MYFGFIFNFLITLSSGVGTRVKINGHRNKRITLICDTSDIKFSLKVQFNYQI